MTKRTLAKVAHDAGLLPQAKKIWRQHPFLEQISCRLADFIGMYPQSEDGKPLLVTAVIRAIEAFDHGKSANLSEHEIVDCYIHGLISTAAQIFYQDVCVETPSGTVKWIPLERSATDFFEHFNADTVCIDRKPEAVPRVIAICCLVVKVVPQALWSDIASTRLFSEFEGAC